MRKKWSGMLLRIGCLLVMLALLSVGWGFAEGLEKDVVVLFTSDVHCGVDQGFGFVGLKAIKTQLEREGCHVLLVDNGDAVQGGPLGFLTQGAGMIEMMNQMGYDIAIPGNHDFDYGMERFLSLTEAATFPFVSCNFNREGELVFPPYVIREFDGVKLAFVGVTTPQTLYTSTPRYFQDETGRFIYGFMQGGDGAELCAAVQSAVDDARAEGADYVILQGHLGYDAAAKPYTYADVLEHTTGIDAMLDGHSHDKDKVAVKNLEGREVTRQACGAKMESVGYLRISAADGSLETGLYNWGDAVPASKLLGIENEMSEVIDGALNALGDWQKTKVGVSTTEQVVFDPEALDASGRPLLIVRVSETNLGDLVTDAFRAQSGADVAIESAGSIRANLPKGDITISNLLSVYPFGNHVAMREVKGQQLLDALEWGVKDVPGGFGGFLQVSGISYEFDPSIKSSCQADENNMFAGVTGEYRVKNVMVGGEPLDLERTYKVAAVEYLLLNHGNGYTMFDGGKVLWQSEDLDYMIVARYIRDGLGGVVGEEYENPYGQGRIAAVAQGLTEETACDPISAADIYQTEGSVILPMDSLRVTEVVTPDDIRHTMDYIEKTKRGEMKQREPLTVVERGDGTYSIIDGNRSYSALKQLGAKNIPAIVVSRPYHKDVETFDELIAIQAEAEFEFHQFVTSLDDEYQAEVTEHSDLDDAEAIQKKAKNDHDGDYGKIIDVLSAEIRIPAEALKTAAGELFEQDAILCVYGPKKDNGYTAYIRLSNGAVAEIRLNEAQVTAQRPDELGVGEGNRE